MTKIFEIKSLYSYIDLAKENRRQQILKGVNMIIPSGTITAVMGPNGSGKSTLAQVVMGNPQYHLDHNSYIPKIILDGIDITDKLPEERAKAGLFLAFQSPIAIPGVNVVNILKTSIMENSLTENDGVKVFNSLMHNRKTKNLVELANSIKETAKQLDIDSNLLKRSVHDEFSGGERKKIELLQALILMPKYAIFDEIDTGLDVDALKLVAGGIKKLKDNGCGIIIITHYHRILDYLTPDFVHIFMDGTVKISGDFGLAEKVEKYGYEQFS